MESKKTTFDRPTHEEVREMFRRAKARQQQLEEEARRTVKVKGEEPGSKEYVAVIIPRIHPQAQDFLTFFDEETAMFNAMKP